MKWLSPVQQLLDPKIHCEEYKLLHCVPLVLVKHIERATPLMYQQQRVPNMFCYLLVWNQFKILIIHTVETLLMDAPMHGQLYLRPLHKTPFYSTAIQTLYFYILVWGMSSSYRHFFRFLRVSTYKSFHCIFNSILINDLCTTNFYPLIITKPNYYWMELTWWVPTWKAFSAFLNLIWISIALLGWRNTTIGVTTPEEIRPRPAR